MIKKYKLFETRNIPIKENINWEDWDIEEEYEKYGNLKDIFIKYLRENQIYTIFIVEFEESDWNVGISFNNYLDKLDKLDYPYIIQNSFDWGSSEYGDSFWEKKDQQWVKYLYDIYPTLK